MAPLFAPLITPFTDQENVDLDMMSRNLEKYEQLPLTGYLVNGSSGEADMLSQSERVALVERVQAADYGGDCGEFGGGGKATDR